MGKAVKKVVKVAAPIAIGAAIGMALTPAAAGAWGSYGGLGSIGTVGTSAGLFGGISASTALQIGGAGLNLMGNIQQQKYAKKTASAISEQTAASNRADEARNRYNQLLQQRARLDQIRQARINQGQMQASMGGSGLGSSGTSSFTGSVGSIGSQTSANLGAINVAESTGNYITSQNQIAANAGSRAANYQGSMAAWEGMASLGTSIFDRGPQIASIFGQA